MRTILKIPFLLVLLTGFWSCENTDPVPTFGNMTGKVQPLKAVKKIYLVRGKDSLRITPKADSTFEITNVPAGKYSFGALANPGYLAPAWIPVVITAGQTMQASPLLFTKLPPTGLFTVKADGKNHSGAPDPAISADSGITLRAGAYIFKILLPVITGPDSFNTATNQDLKMFVYYNGKTWEASQAMGSAILKVTSFNPQTKRGDATFSFKALSPPETEMTGTEGNLRYVEFLP